jgi:hypothetical protein
MNAAGEPYSRRRHSRKCTLQPCYKIPITRAAHDRLVYYSPQVVKSFLKLRKNKLRLSWEFLARSLPTVWTGERVADVIGGMMFKLQRERRGEGEVTVGLCGPIRLGKNYTLAPSSITEVEFIVSASGYSVLCIVDPKYELVVLQPESFRPGNAMLTVSSIATARCNP